MNSAAVIGRQLRQQNRAPGPLAVPGRPRAASHVNLGPLPASATNASSPHKDGAFQGGHNKDKQQDDEDKQHSLIPASVSLGCIIKFAKALSPGVLLIAIGTAMCVVGFLAEQLSTSYHVDNDGPNKNITTSTVNRSMEYHLHNLSFAGPAIMGLGGICIVAACVLTFGVKDHHHRVVPVDEKRPSIGEALVPILPLPPKNRRRPRPTQNPQNQKQNNSNPKEASGTSNDASSSNQATGSKSVIAEGNSSGITNAASGKDKGVQDGIIDNVLLNRNCSDKRANSGLTSKQNNQNNSSASTLVTKHREVTISEQENEYFPPDKHSDDTTLLLSPSIPEQNATCSVISQLSANLAQAQTATSTSRSTTACSSGVDDERQIMSSVVARSKIILPSTTTTTTVPQHQNVFPTDTSLQLQHQNVSLSRTISGKGFDKDQDKHRGSVVNTAENSSGPPMNNYSTNNNNALNTSNPHGQSVLQRSDLRQKMPTCGSADMSEGSSICSTPIQHITNFGVWTCPVPADTPSPSMAFGYHNNYNMPNGPNSAFVGHVGARYSSPPPCSYTSGSGGPGSTPGGYVSGEGAAGGSGISGPSKSRPWSSQGASGRGGCMQGTQASNENSNLNSNNQLNYSNQSLGSITSVSIGTSISSANVSAPAATGRELNSNSRQRYENGEHTAAAFPQGYSGVSTSLQFVPMHMRQGATPPFKMRPAPSLSTSSTCTNFLLSPQYESTFIPSPTDLQILDPDGCDTPCSSSASSFYMSRSASTSSGLHLEMYLNRLPVSLRMQLSSKLFASMESDGLSSISTSENDIHANNDIVLRDFTKLKRTSFNNSHHKIVTNSCATSNEDSQEVTPLLAPSDEDSPATTDSTSISMTAAAAGALAAPTTASSGTARSQHHGFSHQQSLSAYNDKRFPLLRQAGTESSRNLNGRLGLSPLSTPHSQSDSGQHPLHHPLMMTTNNQNLSASATVMSANNNSMSSNNSKNSGQQLQSQQHQQRSSQNNNNNKNKNNNSSRKVTS